MEHETFDNETDNDDVDEEEVPRTPRAPKPAKNGAHGAASGQRFEERPANKESERKKRELITMGKAKGFLTYDEVNEHMPENIVSSDQMDDWLSAFCGRGHRDRRLVVEGQDRRRATSAEAESEEDDEEEAAAAAKKEEAEEEEDADGYSKTNDPVRMYLRKMGSRLAAHARGRGRDRQAHRGRRAARAAGRAQLAGRRSTRSSISATSSGSTRSASRRSSRTPTTTTPSSTRKRPIGASAAHRQGHAALDKSRSKIAEKLGRQGVSRRRQEDVRGRSPRPSSEIVETLEEMRLNKKPIDKIVAEAEGAWSSGSSRPSREITELRAARRGCRSSELRKTLREIRSSPAAPARRRQEARHPPRRARGDVAGHRQTRSKKVKKVEEEAKLDVEAVLRETVRRDPRRRAHGRARPRPSWSRPTCASSSRSRRSTRTAACSSST